MPKMYCYLVTQTREVEVKATDPVAAARVACADLKGLRPIDKIFGEVLTSARESDLIVNEIGELNATS